MRRDKVRDIKVRRLARRFEADDRHLVRTLDQQLLRDAKLTVYDLAAVMSVSRSAVLNKVNGRRQWQIHDVERVLAVLSLRLGRRVSFEEAWVFKPKELLKEKPRRPSERRIRRKRGVA